LIKSQEIQSIMSANETIEIIIPEQFLGKRFDRVLAELCPQYSRSQLQKWIKSGDILLNDKVVNVREKVTGGESILITPVQMKQTTDMPEDISLEILYEDDQLIILNKPVGLVVHPGAGNTHGTLVNALLAHHAEQDKLPRAGIVHRLDKDTSGLMVVAKTLQAHTHLINQFQNREVKKEYLALVSGEVIAGSTIETNIGRHPNDRKKMAVLIQGGGKPAITHFRVEKRLHKHTLLRVEIETGRTHQIRVHLAYKHLPIVGDKVYGGRNRIPANTNDEIRNALKKMNRQALHATRLTLMHPSKNEIMSWESTMPEDMQNLVRLLEIKH